MKHSLTTTAQAEILKAIAKRALYEHEKIQEEKNQKHLLAIEKSLNAS